MNVIRQQIIRTARAYVGTPFKHQGRTEDGLDCIGLIIAVAHNLALSQANFTAYGREPNPRTFLSELGKHLTRRQSKTAGDILVFALPKYPCHTAIYTDIGTVIHSLAKRGGVVEHRLADDWNRKIRSVWSYPGVE